MINCKEIPRPGLLLIVLASIGAFVIQLACFAQGEPPKDGRYFESTGAPGLCGERLPLIPREHVVSILSELFELVRAPTTAAAVTSKFSVRIIRSSTNPPSASSLAISFSFWRTASGERSAMMGNSRLKTNCAIRQS